jgi:tetratricopeptide (TPR) repeat protein
LVKQRWHTLVLMVIFSVSLAHAQKKAKTQTKKLPTKTTVPQQANEIANPVEPSKSKTKRPPLDPSKTVRLKYTNMRWNANSTQIDSATIVIKDPLSGRTVQVQLNESGPDSGEFIGYYNITWGNATEVQPEIYVPNQVIKDDEEAKDFASRLELKNLKRLPFILRKGERGEQLVEVFNNRQEALSALESYKAVTEAKQPIKDTVAAKALLETAELAKIQAQKQKEMAETTERELERKRLEALEQQKAEELRKKQAAMTSAEQEKRKRLAQQQADSAMDLFRAGQFVQAEEAFKKAHELDPNNKSFYFGYGVTLYRNNKFNDSLVILRLAEQGDFSPVEKDFFIGLNHLKLKEYPQALSTFRQAKQANHPQISPSAAFYEGVVLFNDLKYEEAKVSFQEVLDTSSDPKLDLSAEEYIEKIERVLAYIRNKEKTIFISLGTGLQYDSNVLLVNSSEPGTGSPSDIADTRTVLGLGLEYRPIYDKEKEFSAKLRTDMLYSAKPVNVVADPFLVSLKTPYRHKGMLWGKGFRMEIVPGYEILKLDINSSGAGKSFFEAVGDKESYLNSATLDWLNTRIMTDDWFTSYNLKLRSDAVGTDVPATSKGDNDPGASKFNFVWNNMWFINKKKTQAWMSDLGVTMNISSGKNLTYNRLDIGGSYVFPWVWELSCIANLNLFYATYPDATTSRADTNAAAAFNMVRPITEWLKASGGLSYTLNESSASSRKYNKYTATLLLTGDWSF